MADWQNEHQRHVAQFPGDVRDAHKHSSNHREEVLNSGRCGCFHCCATFSPQSISEWTDEADDGQGQTALCPKCGIDSVIGENAGFDLSAAFLQKMRSFWF